MGISWVSGKPRGLPCWPSWPPHGASHGPLVAPECQLVTYSCPMLVLSSLGGGGVGGEVLGLTGYRSRGIPEMPPTRCHEGWQGGCRCGWPLASRSPLARLPARSPPLRITRSPTPSPPPAHLAASDKPGRNQRPRPTLPSQQTVPQSVRRTARPPRSYPSRRAFCCLEQSRRVLEPAWQGNH